MTTVLIVEDDATLRGTIARDLTSQKLTVETAEDVEKALEIVRRQSIDVLLTDLRMPGQNGLDLLEQVQEISPGTRSILMSAFATASDYEAAIALGTVTVLCKPFSRRQLRQAIQKAAAVSFDGGTYHGLSLIDLLQMLHLARCSLGVEVVHSAPGILLLEKGELVHAARGELRGREALPAMIGVDPSSIRTISLPEHFERTIGDGFESLLPELLRLQSDGVGEAEPTIAEAPDRPATRDASTPPRARAIADRWITASRETMGLPQTATVIAKAPRGGSVHVLQGDLSGEELGAVADELGSIARELTDSTCGAIVIVTSVCGVNIVWNHDEDVMVMAVQPLDGMGSSTWFRSRSAAIAKMATPARA